MADLDRVPQLAPALGLGPGTLGKPVAAAFGEGGSGLGIARQQGEEMVEAFGIEAEIGRELPQARAELLLQPQDARGEEIGERGLDLAQPPDVGDVARALDGEHKALRGLVIPASKGVGPLQRIKGAVDLDRLDLPAGIGELVRVQQTGRIKVAAPRRVGPAGDADPHNAAAAHRPEPGGCARRPSC